MFGKKVILLAASILAVSLWGCSSDFDAENTQTSGTGTAVVDASSIGAANCFGCHNSSAWTSSSLWGTSFVDDYLQGKHVIHSTHIDATSGDCLTCHDPFGDGRSLESLIEPGGPYEPVPVLPADEYLPLAGLAAVTCETCHGAGGDHVNGLPIPHTTPDYNRCGQCHNSDFFHRDHGHTAEEDNIVEDYTASKHFSGAIRNSAICVKCHTDEGAIKYREVDTAVALADALPVGEANRIQCRTCHNPHNNSLLLEAATASAPLGSAEYNTCTNCHQRHDATIGGSITQVGSSTDGSSGDLIFHAGSWDRVISSTHWDDPATADKVEGYTMNPQNERACRDCHNVHGADATINKQWASSAHASKIRDAKETAAAIAATPIAQVTAVRAAGADNTHALPHYDWDDTGGWNGSARGNCQRCHTATGAKNYLDAMITINDDNPDNDITYDPANNDFSHLVGWVDGISSSGQNELIYCWGCHANNSGELRNPGGVTLEYTVSAVPVVLPDLGKSNVCATCHGGQGNVESYTDADYTMTNVPSTDMSTLKPGFGPNTKNVTATHYLAAAATIYQAQTKVGYEYAGLSYSDQPFYAHKRVALNSDSPESGSGPCAACHMTAKNHSLDVVAKNGSGVITALKGTICVTCHDGEHALFVALELVGTTQNIWAGSSAVPTVVTQQMADDTAAELEHEAEGFHEALDMLQAELLAKGLTFGSYPYFSGTSWINEGTFGAAHNFNYLHHEPGAYAHNRFYAKRLIFDSIDWLDGDNWNTTGDDPVAGIDNNNLDGIINIGGRAAAWFDGDFPITTPPVDVNRP